MDDMKKYFPELGEQFITNRGDYLKLIPSCKQFDSEDIKLIYKALYKATELHKNSKPRKSGEPYITHPIAVSSLLAKNNFDGKTVAAALLHDTVEDTNYTLNDCEKDFGTTIATLVDGVTKIGHDVNYATHEKILKSVNKDVRSYGIKGIDRLHNMYTLSALKPTKQFEIATETKEFYVPISRILGIYELKDELQDLCLYFLDRKSFYSYEVLRQTLKNVFDKKCIKLGDEVQEELSKLGIGMKYNYRVKNIGGICDDIKNGSKMNEIDDLIAIKMVVDDPSLCYKTLGIVHSLGKQVPGKLEDYIGAPKINGYRSLNTNVVYKDADIQVRIRTNDMQKTNNLGVFSDLSLDTQERVNDDMRKSLSKLLKKDKGE